MPTGTTTTRVGPSQRSETRTTAQNTAKVSRRRANERAENELQPGIPANRRNHLIPQRDLSTDDAEVEHVGLLLAGVEDFKILRGSIAVLSLTTSTEFAHLLADAAMISRGNVLVVDIYQVSRDYLFGDDDDEDEADEG